LRVTFKRFASNATVAKERIEGGYYIKARKVQESEVMHAPPHIREIWDWLLMIANHKDKRFMGVTIKRGQCLRTYNDILEGLSWKVGWRTERYTKWQCEEAMKFLRRGGMITTEKTTRGMLITIVNYSIYQDPKNYEGHKEGHNEHHNSPQSRHTINKNVKNVKKESTQLFEKFWEHYPRKVGKKNALLAWARLKPTPQLAEKIIGALKYAKDSEQWQESRYIPHPTTWLNQERWNDEEFKPPKQTKVFTPPADPEPTPAERARAAKQMNEIRKNLGGKLNMKT